MIKEEIHKKNFELINKYSLKVSDRIKVINKNKMVSVTLPLFNIKNNDVYTISCINKYYGWITFKETEQLPQDAETLFNGCIKLKGGKKE